MHHRISLQRQPESRIGPLTRTPETARNHTPRNESRHRAHDSIGASIKSQKRHSVFQEAIHRLLKERNIRPRLGLRFAHTCYPFEIRPSEEPASADPGINLKSAQGSREMEAAKEESRSSR